MCASDLPDDICTIQITPADYVASLPNQTLNQLTLLKPTKYKFLMFEVDIDGNKYDLQLETISNRMSYYVTDNIINYAFIEKILFDQYKVTINQPRPQIVINIIDDKHISQINRLTMPEQYIQLKENDYQIKIVN